MLATHIHTFGKRSSQKNSGAHNFTALVRARLLVPYGFRHLRWPLWRTILLVNYPLTGSTTLLPKSAFPGTSKSLFPSQKNLGAHNFTALVRARLLVTYGFRLLRWPLRRTILLVNYPLTGSGTV